MNLLELPDLIVEIILETAMQSTVPLCIEYCVGNLELVKQDIPSLRDRLRLHSSQVPELRDWIAINGTCRSIRNLGRPAFFRKKIIAMPPSFAHQIQTSRLEYFHPSVIEDLTRYTRHLVLLESGQGTWKDDRMLTLQSHLWAFEGLRRLDLFFSATACYVQPCILLRHWHRRKPAESRLKRILHHEYSKDRSSVVANVIFPPDCDLGDFWDLDHEFAGSYSDPGPSKMLRVRRRRLSI